MSKVRQRGGKAPVTTSAHPTAVQFITPELRAWIVAQAQAGCRPEDVLAAMVGSGWQEDVAIAAMEETLAGFLRLQPGVAAALPAANAGPADSLSPVSAPPPPGIVASAIGRLAGAVASRFAPATALPEPPLVDAPTRLWAGDREVQVVMTMALPRVVVFGDFLSVAECEELMQLAAQRLVRSETVVNETGGSEVNSARTSDGMFFARAEHPLCARIEQRIATLLRWPVENGEGLQVLRYRPGAEYKPHHDYFDPDQPGAPTILARGGQRVGTLVMYLNTPTKGGATTFPDVGLAVAPVQGNAVFFSYDRPEASTRTLHGGAPVLEGEKWVATKWMRQGVFV